MLTNREMLLCQYRYDPLDRLIDCTPSTQPNTRRFYLKNRLATEIQGTVQRSIMQHEDQLLAQLQRQSGTVETCLLATDQQRSVLNVLAAAHPNLLAYTPYGHRHPEHGLLSLLGFNGERQDPVTGSYLLGNGYRAFNPVLIRFNSPDSWSPFGEGGLNAYAYCAGNPINHLDPTGHIIKFLHSIFSRQPSRTSTTANPPNKTLSLINNSNKSSPTTSKKQNSLPGSAQRVSASIEVQPETSALENLPLEIFEKVTHTVSGHDMGMLGQASQTMNRRVTDVSNRRYQRMLRKNPKAEPQQLQLLITEGRVVGISPSGIRGTGFSPASLHESLPHLYRNRLEAGKIILPDF